MKFNLAGGSGELTSKNIDSQRTINWYPEAGGAGAKGQLVLRPTPGLSVFCTLPTTPVRGLWAGDDRLFAAGGAKLYEVSNAGVATEIGTIANDGTPVTIWPNGTSIFIVSAGQAYIHNGVSLSSAPVPADPFADPATAPGQVGTARAGTFLDGYYIGSKPDSKWFFFSNLNYVASPDDPTEFWDPTEGSSKEGYPDNIAMIWSDHEELWLFGETNSIEVWRNEGDEEMAGGFRRDPGAFIHLACPAPWSVCSMDQSIYFLGGDTHGSVQAYRAQGFQPVRISTPAIEEVWKSYSTVSDAYAYTYVDRGHSFYVVNFLTGNGTWVYDSTTGIWHERAYWNGSSNEKHRGRCHAHVFGKHLVGDHTNGKIYEMSASYTDDAGTAIHRSRTAPHISNEELNQFHHRLQLDIEIQSSSAPSVSLEWSDDDGANWVGPKSRTPSLNNKRGRVIWNRLGRSRDRVYRVSTSSSGNVSIVDAYLQLTGGVS